MICYYILKDGTLRRVDAVPKKFRTLNYFIRRSFFDDNYIITDLYTGRAVAIHYLPPDEQMLERVALGYERFTSVEKDLYQSYINTFDEAVAKYAYPYPLEVAEG